MLFSQEYTNMHSVYGFCNSNATLVVEKYWQQYP